MWPSKQSFPFTFLPNIDVTLCDLLHLLLIFFPILLLYFFRWHFLQVHLILFLHLFLGPHFPIRESFLPRVKREHPSPLTDMACLRFLMYIFSFELHLSLYLGLHFLYFMELCVFRFLLLVAIIYLLLLF